MTMRRLFAALALLLLGAPAFGQTSVQVCSRNGNAQECAGVTGGALDVNATLTPSGTQDVNLTEVGGAAVATGHGTAAGAIRVELPTDGTGLVNAAQSGTWTVQPGNTANTTPWLVTGTPSSASGAGIAVVASTSAESNHVLKASAGNLYTLTVTIGATSGYVLVFDATSAPADGAVTPAFCRYLPSDGTSNTLSLSWAGAPQAFATGITAVFSTTGCFTKTASATASFFGGVK